MPLPTSAAQKSCFHPKNHKASKHFRELSFDAAEERKPYLFCSKISNSQSGKFKNKDLSKFINE